MYIKICTDCGHTYKASGPAGKYCEDCTPKRKERQKLKNRIRAEKRRRREGRRIGRGQLAGEEHSNYKHGYYVAQTQSKKYKEMVEHLCERCGKDLTQANRWEWCMHHKDHNHANHHLDNLELLCKRCHQLDHKCIDNLKVQRLSRNGVDSSESKRGTSINKDDDIVSSA